MNEWIEINIPYGPVFDDEFESLDSFDERGLNNPGVLIMMEDKSEYLIGHINELRGVCDDCVEFRASEIVKAYKIVLKPD